MECCQALHHLAEAPVSDDIDPSPLMLEWARHLQSLDIHHLADNPAFAEPLIRQLYEQNQQLIREFAARRDAIAEAGRQQHRTRAGIDAYRGL